MIKLINTHTGNELYVVEERAAEYLATGCKPSVEVPQAPPLPKNITMPKKKASAKKGTTKK